MVWLINNWYLVVVAIALLVAFGIVFYKFVGLPTKEQINRIKNWLLLAVTKAEKELGSQTGELKLRMVYDMFISKFPVTSKLISFESFSGLVDESLDTLKELLDTNEKVAQYVNI